ncbi:MAG: right-handed parallel beta-helix repeat-containing protein [Parvibaculaceae bacterium]|nr:right-handed parallel beta-helix repeat-containing protein [Parvibaculaceae bacterium]
MNIASYGACGTGKHDDGNAITRAAGTGPEGAIIYFPPGTYRHGRMLRIAAPNIILFSEKAVLQPFNPEDSSIRLDGDNDMMIGFRLTMPPYAGRSSKYSTVRILIGGTGNYVLNNKIDGSRSAGIASAGAQHFTISGNIVSGTSADGIHMTHGSRYGLVSRNIVSNTGDDLIAVVSYRSDNDAKPLPISSDILIANNVVGPNSWGRGISVAGGERITIENNLIKDNATAAGILIAQERAYHTYGASDITVTGNTVVNNQQFDAPPGKSQAGHSALQIAADREENLTVSDVRFINNRVINARYGAFSIRGAACHIAVDGLEIDGGSKKITVSGSGCSVNIVTCKGIRTGKDSAPYKGCMD